MPETDFLKTNKKLKRFSKLQSILLVDESNLSAISEPNGESEVVISGCFIANPVSQYLNSYKNIKRLDFEMCRDYQYPNESNCSCRIEKEKFELISASPPKRKCYDFRVNDNSETCIMFLNESDKCSNSLSGNFVNNSFTHFYLFRHLELLNFHLCNFSSSTWHTLADCFKAGEMIVKKLWFISDVKVGDCWKLMESLSYLPFLQELLLPRCEITNKALSGLSRFIQSPKIDQLNISLNENVGQNVDFLRALAEARNVRVLFVQGCNFTSKTIIKFFTHFKSKQTLKYVSFTVPNPEDRIKLEELFRDYPSLDASNIKWR